MFRAGINHGTDPDGTDVPGSDHTEPRITGVSIAGGGPTRGNDPLSFLQRVLLSRDPELLQQLRKRAAEVTAALDAAAGAPFTDNETRAIAADPRWLAQVYEVLGGEDDTQSREAEIEAAIDDLLGNQEREIAGAFVGLVSSLPQEDMRKWHDKFGQLPEVSQSALQGLQQHWGDASASDDVAKLLRHGITPATFFEATIGLQLLLERCIEDSSAGSKTVVLLEFGHRVVDHTSDPNSVSVPRPQLLAQIRSSADCPTGAEESVLTWTCLAAARHPLIFQGFKVLAASGPVLAVVSDPDNIATDLMHRWMYEPTNDDDRLERPKVANLRWG